MRIITTHLTRMSPGYICVAGVEIESGYHVRPVTFGRLGTHWSAARGGPFDIGEVVDLGIAHHVGMQPETEDFQIDDGMVWSLGAVPASALWSALQRLASDRLVDLFGPDIEPVGQTFAVPEGLGQASLGVLRPDGPVSLAVFDNRSVRCTLSIDGMRRSLPVTDLRFFSGGHQLEPEVFRDARARLRGGVPVLVSVGLGRPWHKPGDEMPRHWLQINNIHFFDNPLWRVSGPPSRHYAEPIPFLGSATTRTPAFIGAGSGKPPGYNRTAGSKAQPASVTAANEAPPDSSRELRARNDRGRGHEPPLAVEIWSRVRRLLRG